MTSCDTILTRAFCQKHLKGALSHFLDICESDVCHYGISASHIHERAFASSGTTVVLIFRCCLYLHAMTKEEKKSTGIIGVMIGVRLARVIMIGQFHCRRRFHCWQPPTLTLDDSSDASRMHPQAIQSSNPIYQTRCTCRFRYCGALSRPCGRG